MSKHLCPDCKNELSPPHQDGPGNLCWCSHCKNIWDLTDLYKYETEQKTKERFSFLEEENKQLKEKFSKIPTKEQFLKDLNDYVSEKVDVLINSFKLEDEYIDSSKSILEHTFVKNTLMDIFEIFDKNSNNENHSQNN